MNGINILARGGGGGTGSPYRLLDNGDKTKSGLVYKDDSVNWLKI